MVLMISHPPEFQDTDPKAMEVWIGLMRKMPPGEKLMAALNLTALAIKFSEAGVRAEYPGISEREVFLRAASRRLSRDLMIRVYGWDPQAHGEPC